MVSWCFSSVGARLLTSSFRDWCKINRVNASDKWWAAFKKHINNMHTVFIYYSTAYSQVGKGSLWFTGWWQKALNQKVIKKMKNDLDLSTLTRRMTRHERVSTKSPPRASFLSNQLCVRGRGGSDSFISPDSITFCCLIKLTNHIYCDASAGFFFFFFWFEWITNRSSRFWGGLTRELPQTDCQKLTLSDSGPKSGVRSEGLQSEAERRRRASSLTADQRWVGGQSVQLVGMRRAQNAAERRDRTPLKGRIADVHSRELAPISAGRSSHGDTITNARGYTITLQVA